MNSLLRVHIFEIDNLPREWSRQHHPLITNLDLHTAYTYFPGHRFKVTNWFVNKSTSKTKPKTRLTLGTHSERRRDGVPSAARHTLACVGLGVWRRRSVLVSKTHLINYSPPNYWLKHIKWNVILHIYMLLK